MCEVPEPNLRVDFAGIKLPSPVLVASGTFGYGAEFARYLDLKTLGGIIVKTITRTPREGNPPPRITETAAGMLNSIGLQNVGVENFLSEKLPLLRELAVPVIANVAGSSFEEYEEVSEMLSGAEGISGVELNVSCPNVKKGGMQFGVDPDLTGELTLRVKRKLKQPLIVKLSPNVTDITVLARAAEAGGADALSVANTFLGMSIDVRRKRPRLSTVFGGLSGPAIKPLALRCVYQVAGAVKIPVLGIGGISTGEDAAEFMLAGATAVAVGTASFVDPGSATRVALELAKYMRDSGINASRDLVGAARES